MKTQFAILLLLSGMAFAAGPTCSTTFSGPTCSNGGVCVNLSYTLDPSNDPVNIFRGIVSGGESTTPINAAPVTTATYQDDTLPAGATVAYYVAKSVNSQGVQSTASNEACAQIPVPPQAPTNLQASPQHD